MSGSSKQGKADIVFALVIILVSTVIYWQTLVQPPPRWSEPLGSAAPRALAIIMAVLALLVLIRALRSNMRTGSNPADTASSTGNTATFIRRPWLAAFSFVLVCAYVAAMDQKLLGFIPATIGFLLLIGLLLNRGNWRQLPWLAGFACVLTLACHLIFTKVFYIDLP
ncbi:MAG: tripartite tricarboxylate transporter TctB family protein [Gammaproteobacteria bacterium]